MLTYTITGDSVEIDQPLRAHIEKRFQRFERFMDPKISHEIDITVLKTTARERQNTFRVEAKLKINSQDFFCAGEAAEIMAAVDKAKEELFREVTHSKAKRQTLFHRGARQIKALLKRDDR